MNLFDRISNLIRANLIDLLERSSNPERDLEKLVVEMENHLAEARTLLADARRVEKEVESQKRVKDQETATWEKKAVLALEKSEEDLAREAVRRKIEAAKRSAELAVEVAQARDRLRDLQEHIEPLDEKLADARATLCRLVRERERAEREKSFEEIADITGEGRVEAERNLADEAALTRLEAKARREMREGGVEARFERLEDADGEINREMERLRAKIGNKPKRQKSSEWKE
jgi:phage shock protein A